MPPLKELARQLKKRREATGALFVVLGMLLVAALAPVLSPGDPHAQHLEWRLQPPVWLGGKGYLGTDALGSDILSRTMYGARMSVVVGCCSVLVAGSLGVTAGLIAGYLGGWWDNLIMRLADVQLTLPPLILCIALMAVLEPSAGNVVLVLGLTNWVTYARVVRSEVLGLKEREFVEAGRAAGAGHGWMLFRHILPNVMSSVIVIATLETPRMIIAEASLSFLGVGVPLQVPTWGGMIAEGLDYVTFAPWNVLAPGVALILTVLSINVLGDWLRDVSDPRTRNEQTG